MNKFYTLILSSLIITPFVSCSNDDDSTATEATATCSDGIMNGNETGVDCGGDCVPCETGMEINNPETFVFERNGQNTISFSGQTTRILMAEEIIAAMKTFDVTEEQLNNMYAHVEGSDDFSDADLNASDKSVRSKTADSFDFFENNATDQALIRADFENFIKIYVEEVIPNENTEAAAGTAGQIADGSSTRYVDGRGLEMNQLFNKSLIGALMVDQILNNYISSNVLDPFEAANTAGTLVEGKQYTDMEHDWDEAYGYAFGAVATENIADPRATIGEADSFLNKYIGRVEGDPDFEGITNDIYQAYKLGRAAIVAQQYDVRNQQAEILRRLISQVIGVRAVYYLQQGKNAINVENPNYGAAFHDLSEGYGFIYSLQFTRRPNSDEPYFTKAQVDALLTDLLDDGDNGLWDVTTETLDALSNTIANEFDFTVEQAGSTD